MRANKATDTKPEVTLRSALHGRGLRFRKDYPVRTSDHTRTRVDIAFTRARVAVYSDGCWWHGCPRHGTGARANADFWSAKLARNRERDRRITASLEADGWRVVRIWQHHSTEEAVTWILAALSTAD